MVGNAVESESKVRSIYQASSETDEAVPFDPEPQTNEEDDGESDFPQDGADE